MSALFAMTYTIIGAIVVLVLVVAVVVGLLLSRKSTPSVGSSPAPAAPPPAPSQAPTPSPTAAPAPAAAPAPKAPPVAAPAALEPSPPTAEVLRPATDGVPALMASETGMAPMLAEQDFGLDSMGEDLPRVGTAEMPQLSDAPARYRTAAAQALKQAIDTMACPKCGAPTFVGVEEPQEMGTDGMGMFKLEGRCGACGHKVQVIDMRVG